MAVSLRKKPRKFFFWLCVTVCCVLAAQRVLFPEYRTPGTLSSNIVDLQPSHGLLSSLVAKRDVTSVPLVTGTSDSKVISAVIKSFDLIANKSFHLKSNLGQSGPISFNASKQGNFVIGKRIGFKGLGVTSKQKQRLASSHDGKSLFAGYDLRNQTLNIDVSDEEIDKLTSLLREKLERLPASGSAPLSRTCNNTDVIGNSCTPQGCLQLELPHKIRRRIEQIVKPADLRVGEDIKVIISNMAAQIPGPNDVIIVTGASSNHYLESQALLDNLHNHLLPHLKNFTFLYYDLGLDPLQRQHMASICKCVLLDFPFHLLPDLVSLLKCYTWKPLVVSAAIQRAELVFWVDASIRFRPDPAHALSLLTRARHRGLQMGMSVHTTIPHTTLPSMFHFFGDEACAYVPYHQCLSGVVIYRNEKLVKRAVLEPWVACAINDQCMCPFGEVDLYQARISCHESKGEHYYGVCHRFDQSALSILVSKLYQEKTEHIMLRDITEYIDIKRGDAHPYSKPSDA
ncbi:hypothetical protein PoB_001507900 [Plakobranchus ocellatus]|uniref:Uncharacterized protein n=1 Tax=Plakobranchus ocellatus TaxID=259542 RepID=A0AAV3YZU5_9GAST|nr:hypothetical protein PoB_001507900 [Plakobranchus ocellatus]